MYKNVYFFLIVATVCLIVALFFSYADENLVFNSQYKLQIWRLLSAHFVHTDRYHLIGNLLAFAILLYLFPISLKKQVQVFIVAIILIDLYLLIFSIQIYAGLSGLIYAIPGAYFFQLLIKRHFKSALLIIVILISHVFVISPHTSQLHSMNWQPLKAAHLLGFIAGLLSLIMDTILKNKPR